MKDSIKFINLTRQDIPDITEDVKTRYQWVPIGILGQDDYFPIITDAYTTSTTNAACIEGVADLIYGKGLYSKNEEFDKELQSLVSQRDVKKVTFDLKLYGNAAFQVMWNRDHTKIKKLFHTPVQNLRAEKIYDSVAVQNYYYCHDWLDVKAQRDKRKIPAFGTSQEDVEILYIKDYTPSRFYYSLPDWVSALQFSFSEAELSNLHINNIENGFLPLVMVNMNNGVPAPEERDTIESMIESKFTGTRNAGRFMVSFNDDPAAKPTIDTITTENLHDKYQYVAEYAQDRILVAHRITSPLLFGIRTANNGFSSQSEEMKTAYSILQTMTIQPFQQLIIEELSNAFTWGGYTSDTELYFEQLTPLAILSTTAEETDSTIEEVEEEINEQMENPEEMEDTSREVGDINEITNDTIFE
jgi:capsid portal protein